MIQNRISVTTVRREQTPEAILESSVERPRPELRKLGGSAQYKAAAKRVSGAVLGSGVCQDSTDTDGVQNAGDTGQVQSKPQ